jgi:hypothetical protein
MASFPGSKVHRVSRRKLGRGQSVPRPGTTLVVTSASMTATLTFGSPVIVSGPIDLHVSGGLVPVTQTQTSPTVVTILYGSTLATHTYSFNGATEPVATFQGGQANNAAGTF